MLFGLLNLGLEVRVFDWINFVVLASTLGPVFGLAYWFAIFRQTVWKLFFILNATIHVAIPIVALVWPEVQVFFGVQFDLAHLIGFFYGLLVLLANYLYAFERPAIWASK